MKHFLFYFLACLLIISPVYAKKKKDEIDYIALAALMIRDGHYDRAETALNSVNLEDKELDLVRLYKLKGVLFLKKEMFTQSVNFFLKALDEQEKFVAGKLEEDEKYQADLQEPKLIHLYLAQAYYKQNKFEETIDALDQAQELALEKPNFYSIKAQCYWKLKDENRAWDILDEAEAKFPTYVPLIRQKFFYLVELQLFQHALEYGEKYLALGEGTVDDYLAIGSTLRKNRELDKAISVLEKGKLKYPADVKLMIELAHTYLEQEKVMTAAMLFEEASRYENKYSQEAAELFKRAKKLYHALYLNSKIADPVEKYKQRMSLFLEFNDMEMAAAMAPSLSRVGLLKNEDMRYALAYSQYMVGHFDEAEENLQKLTRPDLFRKAAELRKSMEECVQDAWKCQ